MSARSIVAVRPGQATTDGDGVAIKRVALMGDPLTDPVLLVDELRSPFREDFAGGFPAHPHRGMQTLTYMKEGGIIHQDSMGNRGEIRGGGAQYMSAGRGVIHSEMPTLDTQGLHGFQLWFNLPAADKMAPPRYRDIPVDELTHAVEEGWRLSAIAGSWHIDGTQVSGPLAELEPQAALADLQLDSAASVSVGFLAGTSALAYLYDGQLSSDNGVINAGQLVILGVGDHWQVTAGSAGAGLLVMRGHPIGEPVVGYGPFVMNTREEIEQAVRDYQSGRLVAGG